MQVNRWLSVRLELLGISVVFGTAIFAGVLLPRSAGIAGLAITSALNLTGLLNWFVRTTTELEVRPSLSPTSFNIPPVSYCFVCFLGFVRHLALACRIICTAGLAGRDVVVSAR